MKSQIDALRKLIEAAAVADEVEGLKLFAAARVIADIMEDRLESEETPGRAYTLEKLSEVLDSFRQAVMPEGGRLTRKEQLEDAGFGLSHVEELVSQEKK
jgi:hypothetical protein